MSVLSPAWPHGNIDSVFSNVFFVMGTNITEFEGNQLQHSRNMIIVREKDVLTLINTVRLTEKGLAKLEALGKVQHIVRLGAFHGRDDEFYQQRYQAKLWVFDGMIDQENPNICVMRKGDPLPISNSEVFEFTTSKHPEGVLFLKQNDGIMVSCDSIKNWVDPDSFFSAETASAYQNGGLFGEASLSAVWLEATGTQRRDFDGLLKLDFNHLLSAHGEPLLNRAKTALSDSVKEAYK